MAHCGLEAYSVLTRLPPPHRMPSALATRFLQERFPSPWLTLSAGAVQALVGSLHEAGVRGGGTYDAVVAATAREAGATLVSLDVRAAPVYARFDVDIEWLDR